MIVSLRSETGSRWEIADLLPKFLACDGYLGIAIKFLNPTLSLFLMPGLQWKRLAGRGNVLPELLGDAS